MDNAVHALHSYTESAYFTYVFDNGEAELRLKLWEGLSDLLSDCIRPDSTSYGVSRLERQIHNMRDHKARGTSDENGLIFRIGRHDERRLWKDERLKTAGSKVLSRLMALPNSAFYLQVFIFKNSV